MVTSSYGTDFENSEMASPDIGLLLAVRDDEPGII